MPAMRSAAVNTALVKRRRLLLPAVLAGSLVSLVAHRVFVPPPTDAQVPPTAQREAQSGASAVATATIFSTLGSAILPAHAGVDSPLAHGAPGVFEDGVLQSIFEKGAFGGLLLSTACAWWRATLGNNRAQSQELAGRPYYFWSLALANLSIVLILCNRWYESGHFPLSNMYESLMFLAWGVTAVTLYFCAPAEQQSKSAQIVTGRAASQSSDVAAVWASPVGLGIVAFAALLLPKELQKASALVPALQSNWLVMHVSVVMMSYATLLFGSILCMAVLVLAQPEDSPLTVVRKAIMPAIKGVADGFGAPQQPAVATSPQVPVEAAAAMSISEKDLEQAPGQQSPRLQVAASSGATVTVEFSQASSTPVQLTEDQSLSLTLDDLGYRSLLLGFGFLTIGIVSGAVWANEAWGSYWSWDPKETWALITWLVYAGYLHTRLTLGWDARDSAKIGAFGFLVVWVCYIGVNLMGIGLHSYGFFLK